MSLGQYTLGEMDKIEVLDSISTTYYGGNGDGGCS